MIKRQVDVNFNNKYIRLFDKEGKEIVCWDMDEWKDDPEAVFSILNAVVHIADQNLKEVMDSIKYGKG